MLHTKKRKRRTARPVVEPMIFNHVQVAVSFPDNTTLGFEKFHVTKNDLRSLVDILRFIMAGLPPAEVAAFREAIGVPKP